MMENVFHTACAEKKIQALVTRATSAQELHFFKQMKGFLRIWHILPFFDVLVQCQMQLIFEQCFALICKALV